MNEPNQIASRAIECAMTAAEAHVRAHSVNVHKSDLQKAVLFAVGQEFPTAFIEFRAADPELAIEMFESCMALAGISAAQNVMGVGRPQ